MKPTLRPPSGYPPPSTAVLRSGEELSLEPLAAETCRRYREEFPDEEERYGDAGHGWCVHDTKWLLWWAIRDIEHQALDFGKELGWLARVLAARGFPLDRLARDLEIAADVLDEREGETLDAVAQGLRAEATNLL